jgi:hypothetical protein
MMWGDGARLRDCVLAAAETNAETDGPVRVLGWPVSEVVIEPCWNTFEVLVAARQDAGLHHDLPDVVDAGSGRQFIE